MAYLGNTSTTQSFTPAIDYFSGNGSTTAFTLSKPVASVAQIQVTIDNVAQNPLSAYSVLNNTITFTSAPLAGTNNIYVYYTSPITQVIAPGQGTVTTASLSTSLAVPAAQLTGTQTLPKGTLPTGSVLQVVQGVTTTQTSISAGPTDTTLTATITPTSATSKILIIVNQIVYLFGGGSDSGFQLFILKNGSIVYNNSQQSLYLSASVGNPEIITNYPITYLDSPATTSALTYKTQATATSGGTPQFQYSSNQSIITLMEISA